MWALPKMIVLILVFWSYDEVMKNLGRSYENLEKF